MKFVKVIVFDFDGTLVDSQKTKLKTYYDLFPPDRRNHSIIKDVVDKMPEESRYVIISSILSRIDFDTSHLDDEVIRLAREYDRLVLQGVKNCREIPGASDLLEAAFGRCHLYLSSNTPTESLLVVVRHRGWFNYFKEIYGYPYGKEAALRKIIDMEKIDPEELLVVGDGQSDRLSAESVGCSLYAVHGDYALLELKNILGIYGDN